MTYFLDAQDASEGGMWSESPSRKFAVSQDNLLDPGVEHRRQILIG